MNGPQDVGGRDGFGAIAPETDEPLFHAPWEARALAVTLAAGALGRWGLDESRSARESLHPADYYTSSYYAIWIKALEKLLVRHGLVSEAELGEGCKLDDVPSPEKILTADKVASTLAKGGPVNRDPQGRQPAFAVGAQVRTRNLQPPHHTRLPAYARDKAGVIEAVRGFHVFPDKSALGDRAAADWLYTVRFEATELFGERAEPGATVSIDAWEPYLAGA
jgi:nitrile hydratase